MGDPTETYTIERNPPLLRLSQAQLAWLQERSDLASESWNVTLQDLVDRAIATAGGPKVELEILQGVAPWARREADGR